MLKSFRKLVAGLSLIELVAFIALPLSAQALTLKTMQFQNAGLNQQAVALNLALCQQDWTRVIQAMGPLLGSELLSAQERMQLMQLRHQVQDFQLYNRKVDIVEGCEGVAIAPPSDISPSSNTAVSPTTPPPSTFNWGEEARKVQQQSDAKKSTTPTWSDGSLGGTSYGGSSGSGNCQHPWQTDSRGRRCGGRAASRRRGGR